MTEQQSLLPEEAEPPSKHVQGSPFVKWYSYYPKHKSRGRAVKAWEKATQGMSRTEEEEFSLELRNAVKAQIKHRKEQQAVGAFTPEWPYPATWLNAMSWLDELEDADKSSHPKLELGTCDEPNCEELAHGPKFTKCAYHFSMSAVSKHNTAVSGDDLRKWFATSSVRRGKGEPLGQWIRRQAAFVRNSKIGGMS